MNIQKMLKQAQEMQGKIAQAQAQAETIESEGASGGGMVRVTLNGKGQALKLSIDPKLIDPGEKEMLEDLLIAAFNDAKAKAESAFADEMGKVTAGLQLPPGMKLPF